MHPCVKEEMILNYRSSSLKRIISSSGGETFLRNEKWFPGKRFIAYKRYEVKLLDMSSFQISSSFKITGCHANRNMWKCVTLTTEDINLPQRFGQGLHHELISQRFTKVSSLHITITQAISECGQRKCFIQGEAELAVRPELPVPGVTVILGNGLVGARVWSEAESPPAVVVAPVPLVRAEPDDSEHNFPETFPACAVTRAMAAASTDTDPTLTPDDGEGNGQGLNRGVVVIMQQLILCGLLVQLVTNNCPRKHTVGAASQRKHHL
ncbi:uncharacterized protein V6R79_001991 [Siganus canaliculatus]